MATVGIDHIAMPTANAERLISTLWVTLPLTEGQQRFRVAQTFVLYGKAA